MEEHQKDIHLEPGAILDGRYVVLERLGQGSMGAVYKCRNADFPGSSAAVKILSRALSRNETAIRRLRNELVACYNVKHPNVVAPFELFRHEDFFAFSMEYIDGGDLAGFMEEHDPIKIDESLRLLSQMATGLQAIHEAGIIHRDLKPENVLLTSQAQVKICDFGTARMEGGAALTKKGSVVGTVNYLSPEYIQNGTFDFRSDIYSLGVIAYELISGKLPFRADSVIETMNLKLAHDPDPLEVLVPECPTLLAEMVNKAMARNPEKRFQSAGEFLTKLKAIRPTISVKTSSLDPR